MSSSMARSIQFEKKLKFKKDKSVVEISTRRMDRENKLQIKIINWWNELMYTIYIIHTLNTWTNERDSNKPKPIKQIVANYYNNLLLCLLK